MKYIFLFGLWVTALWATARSEKIIIAYYHGGYEVSNLPVAQLDVINYAFLDIDDKNGVIKIANEEKEIPVFYQLAQLKNIKPELKIIISVGGWGRSKWFSNVAATQKSREKFARSCVEFLKKYDFDGVDIDWEFPVEGGLPDNIYRKKDKRNYLLLLKELRKQLDESGDYLLTIAGATSPDLLKHYKLKKMAQYLDWFNVMTYDFHGQWGTETDRYTNFNSPLYPVEADSVKEPYRSILNFDAAVKFYLQKDIPKNKIIPGAPFYGKGYGHVPNKNNGLFQPYDGGAVINGEERMTFNFRELSEKFINKNGYVRYWSEEARVPWLYNDETQNFITYDDEESVKAKAAYVLEKDLPGLMFWEISQDKDNKLLNAIYQTFYP